MTCLKHTIKPSTLRNPPRVGGGATHQHATLLSLHFRSAAWTPCVPGPALLAASAIVRTVEKPAAQWDVWYFPRGSSLGAATCCTGRTSIRRARLRAAASVVTDDDGVPWIAVMEERLPPGSAPRGRRMVALLRTNPYGSDLSLAPIDERAVEATCTMSVREASSPNPLPDLTVDLEALGLVAPRPASW